MSLGSRLPQGIGGATSLNLPRLIFVFGDEMGRPERHDVDYFPFYVKEGRTLFALESKYGCTGTGFFTNVLRFLARTPDHYTCIADQGDQLWFFSKMHCDEEAGIDMLNMMARTGKIDFDLWNDKRVIVSKDFLASVEDAYRKRSNNIITLKDIQRFYDSSDDLNPRNWEPEYKDWVLTKKEKDLRDKARKEFARALKSGKIVKQPCQICGDKDSEAHHPDYNFPLDVIWFCKLHHAQKEAEKRIKEEKGAVNEINTGDTAEQSGENGQKSGLGAQTKEKDTKEKDTKEKKNIYGEFSNVRLTAEEYHKLIHRFGKTETESMIEALSSYIASKGKKYKSHYATILNWDRMEGDKNGDKRNSRRISEDFLRNTPTENF